MAVRTPADSDPDPSDGTPTGTEVLPLTQHPIRELPLAREKGARTSLIYTPTKHITTSCYPIGQATIQPKATTG
ncbi:hypothetical protein TNCV_4809041 [Trichonephila clavipes]|nr:hypothetical protein TNCV_4809041 [Trichonephila clavipes]